MNTREAAAEFQKQRGVTDAQMARLIHVSRSTWCRYKHADCELTAANERALNAVLYEAQAPNMLPQLKEDLEICIKLINDPSLNRSFVWTRCLNVFKTYIFADSIPAGRNQTDTKSTTTP